MCTFIMRVKFRLGEGGHCSVIWGIYIGQVRLGQVHSATVRSYGGVCIGQVRLGQVKAGLACDHIKSQCSLS